MSIPVSYPILVVDDDPDVLDAVLVVLRSAGYQVRCALGGAAAVAMMREGPLPALVITDLMMPDMSGWELVDAMRADPALCDVPIVAATASIAAKPPPGVPLLEKPCELQTLLDMVEKHRSHAPAESGARPSTPEPGKRVAIA